MSRTTVGTGQVIEGVRTGNTLLAVDGLVTIGQTQLDPESRLGGQLRVVDQGLDVAHIVDRVYRGGAVPDFATLAAEFAEAGAAAATVPGAPAPPPTPNQIVVDLNSDGVPEGVIIGRDSDGNLLLDRTGNGQPDAIIRPAASEEPGSDTAGRGGDGIVVTELGEQMVIRDGQTLVEIAHQNGVSIERLMSVNPGLTGVDDVGPGDSITLPPEVEYPGHRQDLTGGTGGDLAMEFTPNATYREGVTIDDIRLAFSAQNDYAHEQWLLGEGVVGPKGYEGWGPVVNDPDHPGFNYYQMFAYQHDLQATDAGFQDGDGYGRANAASAEAGFQAFRRTGDLEHGLQVAREKWAEYGYAVKDQYTPSLPAIPEGASMRFADPPPPMEEGMITTP